MSTHPDEQPLGSPTASPDVDMAEATPAIELPAALPKFITVEDVLATAALPRKKVAVCIRPDLQARYDAAMAELATLITPTGELIPDPDASLDQAETTAARARELADTVEDTRREMTKALWWVEFEGMTSEDLAVFNKQHKPKGTDRDMTDYNLRLIASCAVEPAISVEQAYALHRKLGTRAVTELLNGATSVCYEGGVSIPKSPATLLNLAR